MESTQEPTPTSHCALIVVMGVSGTGKSTLGTALAHKLGLPYVEGDDLHPRSNVEKMSSGIPLTDEDRGPWLALIKRTAEEKTAMRRVIDAAEFAGVVIACSALKKNYRDILRGRVKPQLIPDSTVPANSTTNSTRASSKASSTLPDLPTYFVFISGPTDVLRRRMEARPGHFMKVSMLNSQLATLESPEDEEGVVSVSLESETEKQVRQAMEGLRKMGLPLYQILD